MAVYQIFRGNTRRLNHAVTRRDEDGVAQPENLAGASLLFTAKRNKSDTYAQAIIKKTTVVDEGITITDSAGGLAQTLILPADTVGLTARTVLFYDLELQTALNEVETVEYGTIIVELDITDATDPVGPPAAPPDPITPGVFLQHDGDTQVWSSWTLPEEVLVGDVNKVLTVSAAGVVTAEPPAAVGGLTPPADPADDGKAAFALGGDLVYTALPTLLTAPTNPTDDNRFATASAGNLAYPSGNRYTGGASGTDGLDTRVPAKVQTTNATVTPILTYTPAANETFRVTAHALAHEPATGDTCFRARTATFRCDSGVVTRVGAATVDGDGGNEQDAGAAAWDLTIEPSGGDVVVSIQGEAAHTIDWQPAIQLERLAA
jgi:hypothetical protein